MKNISFALAFFLLVACSSPSKNNGESDQEEPKIESGWQSLFNGKDLDDWNIKIAKHDFRENYNNTFKVEDGLIKVRYDGYQNFDQQYGHMFYKEPFSHYLIRVEYRFVGEQAPGGEGWALRNSGVMLHCQSPESMAKDQDFPVSIEAQLLGGDGENERTTSNLCTPGTHVVIADTLFTPHCLSSSSKTYHGDQWVTADFLVLGDSIVHHILEGDTVLTYQQPQTDDGKLISGGYISLQSESHPIDFRKVEIFDLSPYKDNKEKLQKILDEQRLNL